MTVGLEWLRYSNSSQARVMPPPRSLAHPKREISETKWAEARQWEGSRASGKQYKMPSRKTPDGTVASCSKRLTSRCYQLKTGHRLTVEYLRWTKNQPSGQCWW